MKKNTLIYFVSLIFIFACQQDYVIKSHGISYLEIRQKLIVLNKTNKKATRYAWLFLLSKINE